MHRLVGGDGEEIGHEVLAHLRPEPPRHVEREVDGDEFDMGEGMPQGDSPPL